jgi:hypothetical protein
VSGFDCNGFLLPEKQKGREFPRPFARLTLEGAYPQVQALVPQQQPVSQHPLVQPQLVSFMLPPCEALAPPSQDTTQAHSRS